MSKCDITLHSEKKYSRGFVLGGGLSFGGNRLFVSKTRLSSTGTGWKGFVEAGDDYYISESTIICHGIAGLPDDLAAKSQLIAGDRVIRSTLDFKEQWQPRE